MSANIPYDILEDWIVLVVDDEMDSLEVAETVLQFYGAEVLLAENGRQALEIIKNRKDDLKFVLSDLSMPIIDGWELLYEVKNDPAISHIPMIALTAHAMQGDRERAISAGFYNYLTKPFTPSKLITELVALLDASPVLSGQLKR